MEGLAKKTHGDFKKWLEMHLSDSIFGSTGFGVVFGAPKDKFHGDFIPNGCYSIMNYVRYSKEKLNYNSQMAMRNPSSMSEGGRGFPCYVEKGRYETFLNFAFFWVMIIDDTYVYRLHSNWIVFQFWT
jgi:hypothetical protein